MVPNGQCVPVEADPKPFSGEIPDEHGGVAYPSDFSPRKPRGEILLGGLAHVPDGPGGYAYPISLKVDELHKELLVTGPREVQSGLFSDKIHSLGDATDLPLSYRHAFGGQKFDYNPIGVGHEGLEFPRIGYPHLVDADRSHQIPAGFSPIPADWPQRTALQGTFRKDYASTNWPWWPDDFDPGYYQCSPPDQQVSRYWRGDELLSFGNLHPEHREFRTRLPGLNAYCFIRRITNWHAGLYPAKRVFRTEAVPLFCDTIWADPGKEILVLNWRGGCPIQTIKFPDLFAVWFLLAPPGSSEAAQALAEQDFLTVHNIEEMASKPPSPPPVPPAASGTANAPEAESSVVDPEIAAWAKNLQENAGLVGGMPENRSKLSKEALDALQEVEAIVAAFEADPVAKEKSARAAQDIFDTKANNPELQKNVADVLDQLKALGISVEDEGPTLEERHAEAQKVISAHQENAKALEASFPKKVEWTDFLVEGKIDPERMKRLGAENIDFTGAPLEGLNLSEISFIGSNFSGLSLKNTNFSRCLLEDCQFDHSVLERTVLAGAALVRAHFGGAKVKGAIWKGAICNDAVFTDVCFDSEDLGGLIAPGASFQKCSMKKTDLSQAVLVRAEFPHSDLSGANLQNAMLSGADLRNCKAPGSNFREAFIDVLRTDEGTDFTDTNFESAKGEGAIFEDCLLPGANFRCGDLKGSRFVAVNASRATFEKADLREVTFDDANLGASNFRAANCMSASFERANCEEAIFDDANLFEAGFWEATLHRAYWRRAHIAGSRLARID